LAFSKAKKEEHVASLDTIDAWNKFKTNVTKWSKISTKVMNAKFSIQMKNGVAYKDIWAFCKRFQEYLWLQTRNNKQSKLLIFEHSRYICMKIA
jgi:hypothetical protein